MRKILTTFCLMGGFALANVINSVVISVDKEPITSYDIEQYTKALGVPRDQAIAMLINEKMENVELRKFEIFVNDLELDENINKMLEQSGGSMQQLRANLKAQNQSFESFRAQFKRDLEKRKLYEKIIALSKLDYSDEGAKNYFEKNRDKFSIYAELVVQIYKSNDKKALENVLKNAKMNYESASLSTANTDPRLLALLSSVNAGGFSPILNDKEGFVLYKIVSKNNPQNPEFSDIKNEVLNAYLIDQRQNAIQNHFEKLRAKINIEYLQ